MATEKELNIGTLSISDMGANVPGVNALLGPKEDIQPDFGDLDIQPDFSGLDDQPDFGDLGESPLKSVLSQDELDKQATSQLLAGIMNLDPQTVHATYNDRVLEHFKKPMSPSGVRKQLEAEGYLAVEPGQKDPLLEEVARSVVNDTPLDQNTLRTIETRNMVSQVKGYQEYQQFFIDRASYVASQKPSMPGMIFSMPENKSPVRPIDKIDMSVVVNENIKSEGGGFYEFYPADEDGNPNPGRPTMVILDSKKWNQLSKKEQERAILGEKLHGLTDADSNYASLRSKFKNTLTKKQKAVDRRYYNELVSSGEENRSFEDWFEVSRLDGYIRGFIAPDRNDEWRKQGVYTPEQKILLGEIASYIMTPGEEILGIADEKQLISLVNGAKSREQANELIDQYRQQVKRTVFEVHDSFRKGVMDAPELAIVNPVAQFQISAFQAGLSMAAGFKEFTGTDAGGEVAALREAAQNIEELPIDRTGAVNFIANTLGQTMPTTLVSIMLGGASAGAFAGQVGQRLAFYAGAAASGYIVEKEFYKEELLKQGVPEDQAEYESRIIGAINAHLEFLQADTVIDFLTAGKRVAIKDLSKTVSKSTTKKIMASGGRITKEGVSMFNNEGITEALQGAGPLAIPAIFRGDYPKTPDGKPDWTTMLNRINEEYWGGGVAGLFLGGAGRIHNKIINIGEMQEKQKYQAAALMALDGLSEEQAKNAVLNMNMRANNGENNYDKLYREEVGPYIPAKQPQKAMAHAMIKEKALPEQDYRKLAFEVTGKNSMADMTYSEAYDFIERLKTVPKAEPLPETKHKPKPQQQTPQEAERALYDELLEKAQAGDMEAQNQLVDYVQNLHKPTYDELLEKASSGDQSAVDAIQNGDYRIPPKGKPNEPVQQKEMQQGQEEGRTKVLKPESESQGAVSEQAAPVSQEPDIFIRERKPGEQKLNPNTEIPSIIQKEGYKAVYKPSGGQGPGFYYTPIEKRQGVNTRAIAEVNKEIENNEAYKMAKEEHERIGGLISLSGTYKIHPKDWGEVRDAIEGDDKLKKVFIKAGPGEETFAIDEWASGNFIQENMSPEEIQSFRGQLIPGYEGVSSINLFTQAIRQARLIKDGGTGKINETYIRSALSKNNSEAIDLKWLIAKRDMVRQNAKPEEIDFAMKLFYNKEYGELNADTGTKTQSNETGDTVSPDVQADFDEYERLEREAFQSEQQYSDEEINTLLNEAFIPEESPKANKYGYADTPYTRIFGLSERGGSILGDIVHNLWEPEIKIKELSKELGSKERAVRFYELWEKRDEITAEKEFIEYSGKGAETIEARRKKAVDSIKWNNVEQQGESKEAAPVLTKQTEPATTPHMTGDKAGQPLTETEVRQKLIEKFTGVSQEQIDAVLSLWQANAETQGKTLDQWIADNVADITSGKEGPKDALLQEVDAKTLTSDEWSKVSRYLKNVGYDIRGGADAKQLYEKAIARGYDIFNKQQDWNEAYLSAKGQKKAVSEKAPTGNIDKKRIRELGYTNDVREAGYLTADGNYIDLSGKREGGSPGTRSYDHREAGGTEGMLEFMNQGNIRLFPESGGIDVMRPLTPKQESRLSEWIDSHNGEVTLDLQDGIGRWNQESKYYSQSGRRTSIEFTKGTKPNRVIGMIKRFYAGEEVGGTVFYQESSPIFYSKLTQLVTDKMPASMQADQMRQWIKGQGIKDEEMEWSGLNDLEGKVTKQQVLDTLAANNLQIEEVVKGSEAGGFGLTEKEIKNAINSIENWNLLNERFPNIKSYSDFENSDERDDYLRGGEYSTKFSSYQLPGGQNYRELLMRLPIRDFSKISYAENKGGLKWEVGFKDGGYEVVFARNETDAKTQALEIISNITGKESGYKSPHWEETNILAHVRFNDRTDVDGKRVLFIEEIQSDWHQAGREKGYAEKPLYAVKSMQGSIILKQGGEGKAVYSTREEAEAYASRQKSWYVEEVQAPGVPNAPFKKTWPELAFKRMLRYAAENGYDSIAWTTGEQQAERYDLSQQVSEIAYWKEDNKIGISVAGINGETIIDSTSYSPEKLEDVVGKELAKKIVNDEGEGNPETSTFISDRGEDRGRLPDGVKVIQGDNLKVGGEGMKGFYDQILPATVNKYVKKWGGRVGETEINTHPGDSMNAPMFSTSGEAFAWVKEKGLEGKVQVRWESRYEQYSIRGENGSVLTLGDFPGEKVHSLPITPDLIKSVMAGQPLFQGKKAAVQFLADGKAVIHAFENADISSLVHETGHIFRRQLTPEDRQIAEDEIGVKDGIWTRENEEHFARGFEKYLAEGKSANSKLANLFEKFKTWLLNIYQAIKGSDIDVKVSKELAGVFDRLLATKQLTDMLGRPVVGPSTSGKTKEFLSIEDFKTIAEQERINAKDDAVGQMDFFGGVKKAEEKAPAPKPKPKDSTGTLFQSAMGNSKKLAEKSDDFFKWYMDMKKKEAAGKSKNPAEQSDQMPDNGLGNDFFDRNDYIPDDTLWEKITDASGEFSQTLNKYLAPISTRIINISERLFYDKLNRYDFDLKQQLTRYHKVRDNFERAIKNMKKKDRIRMEFARWNASDMDVEFLCNKYGIMDLYHQYRAVEDEIFAFGKEVGYDIEYLEGHFARSIKPGQVDKLLDYLKSDPRGIGIQKMLEERANKLGYENANSLPEEERAKIINVALRGYTSGQINLAAPGWTKTRTLPIIDTELAKFFEPMAKSTADYIDRMTTNIAQRKFFGRQSKEMVKLLAEVNRYRKSLNALNMKYRAMNDSSQATMFNIPASEKAKLESQIQEAQFNLDQAEKNYYDQQTVKMEDTVGGWLDDQMKAGLEITPDQQKKLKEMLSAYFQPKGPGAFISTAITLGHIEKLSQFTNILTQVGEVIFSLNESLLKTFPNWGKSLAMKSDVKLDDIGIEDWGQESVDDKAMQRVRNVLLTGMTWMDRANKETFINTVFDKYTALAKSNNPKAQEKLKIYFGDNAGRVLADLKNGNFTDDIKYFLFCELAEIQPITKLEVPEGYLTAGNARLFYTLQTFSLKRLDILRRRGAGLILDGVREKDKKKALKGLWTLIYLATLYVMSDTSIDVLKDILRGKEPDISYSVQDNLWQIILLNKYNVDKARTGGPSVIAEGFVPTFPTLDRMAQDYKNINDPGSIKYLESTRSIPAVGEAYYWWLGEGRRKVESGYYQEMKYRNKNR